MTDWGSLIENCPGVVAGLPPELGGWGYVDIQEAKQFEAMQYLNHRGVIHLTPDYSPHVRCVRLKFKGGIATGLLQKRADADPSEHIESWPEYRERVQKHSEEHPSLARRLGRRFGKRR